MPSHTNLIWPLIALSCAAPAVAEVPLAVQIVTAQQTARSSEYVLAGTLEAKDSVPTSFRDGGRLVSVAVHTGDRVTPGQELARVDASQAEAGARAADAALAGADATLVQATSAFQRIQGLVDSGVATRAELDAAAQSQALAQGQHDQAAAQVKKAAAAVQDTVLRATVGAVVTARDADPGQVVAPGQTVLTLASEAAREAIFLAPDSVDIDPYIGRPLRLTLIDRPDVVLDARVTDASPVVDAATATVRVKALVLTPPGADMLLGAPVLGHLQIDEPPAIHVPSAALTSTAASTAVWTVDPATMTVRLTPVTIAGFGAEDVTIGAGLNTGDLVVGAGSQMLYPGRVVAKAEVGE
jgi:RND family efflux transporter MFP subunit